MRNRYDILSTLKSFGAESASTTGESKQFGHLPEQTKAIVLVKEVSGDSPSLNVVVEASNDEQNWNEILRINNITSTQALYRSVGEAPFSFYRVRSEISGTSPTFDYLVMFSA